MKLPLSWLNDYVKVDDVAPAELAEKLTRAGLQVESVETVGGVPLSDSFVVVEVTACEPHPDSDHLHVCRVTDGAEEFQVVCGAPNMRLGIKTAFAKIGAVVPEGGFNRGPPRGTPRVPSPLPLSPFSPPDRDRRGNSPAWSGRGSRPSRRTSG